MAEGLFNEEYPLYYTELINPSMREGGNEELRVIDE